MSSAAPAIEAASCQRALDVLESESAALCGNRERIEAACSVLRDGRELLADPALAGRLPALARTVSGRVAGVNAPIIALLCDLAEELPDAWALLERLLDSSDGAVIARAMETLGRVARRRRSGLAQRVLRGLAVRADREGSALAEESTLQAIARLFEDCLGGRSAIESLCAGGADLVVRRLAARVLDLSPRPPTDALATEILGADAVSWLAPYLAWTRATHRDLIALAGGEPETMLQSLRRAEGVCGEKLLREIIGEVGWPRLNLGLSVRRFAGMSIGGSFPLLVSAPEAALLDDIPQRRQVFDRFLAIALGGGAGAVAEQQHEVISRFRSYNLAHADLLAGFLEVTPLTIEKVRLTVERMDRVVEEFQFLFSGLTEECPALASMYGDLRDRIETALAGEPGTPGPLSPELTRLVEMFEDPRSLAEVHTLHGLKRYLHQRGLKLGMSLAESGRSANRTVTLVLATPERVVNASTAVEYVDFEGNGDGSPPYSVQLVIDEFGRQLIHAEQPPPKVKIFAYGNEVHYFIAYRNHPAFVRIDYSPPGRGGMIDLAYFGVSKYELDAHPAVSLPALQRFFKRLDFNIEVENTHVHARYDKERAFDLDDLCQKAATLFRLAPYLMDLDWVIGDLALSTGAREQVATAWADFFAEWGVLPYQQFLTGDRRGILTGIDTQAAAERELRWNGSGAYRDRFASGEFIQLGDGLRTAIARRALQRLLPAVDGTLSQLRFEQLVAKPLRAACSRGEVSIDDLRIAPAERFERRHPAECLVEVLRSDAGVIAASARLADIVALLSRGLRFRTTGAINGYEVHAAALPLPGETISLYVLRDGSGIFRLALYAAGDSLHLTRKSAADRWQENWSLESGRLITLLRRANYPTPWVEPPAADPDGIAAHLRELFREQNVHAAAPPLPGESVLGGVPASPGRAVGQARLGLANRHPSHVDGCVVVCEAMSPADGAFLGTALAVVTTGGGALSHAGLLALQYGKPALIVSGTWQRFGASLSALTYRTLQYDEQHRVIDGYRVTERHELREREEVLHEGDLVVVDGERGTLRILGQEPDALAFHDSLRQLDSANRQLAAATDPEILVERGRRLRALHQLERVLGRLADPVLARHAVGELLLQDGGSDSSIAPAEKGGLLRFLLRNRAVGKVALEAVHLIVETMTRRLAADTAQALRLIPECRFAWEALSLRVDVRRLAAVVMATRDVLAASGVEVMHEQAKSYGELELLTTERLRALRQQLLERASALRKGGDLARLRHAVAEIDRIDLTLGTEGVNRAEAVPFRELLELHDETVWMNAASRRIIDARSGGVELRPLAGTKAANLAQVDRFGEGALVPPWFVVTDLAFREALQSPLAQAPASTRNSSSVRAAVDEVLARADLTNGQKASLIRTVWDAARLPDDLVDEVRWAYATLSGIEEPFVAVRSSATEEDIETATRAGEFDTFLFVRGEDGLIENLRRAWSGLWSERALHNRAVFGYGGSVGGGVIVQKMIASQVSGVLHTVNVAERRLHEMVINAGLGLGEGVVSGAVAADRIVVSKEGDLQQGELHFRYLTAEKRERVVFNSRLGSGTARVETLYHQRLRPALEYVDICQLVRAADRLERAYGYPLDIEFAIEGTNLYLLQVRPVPTPAAVWRDSVERWPLAGNRMASLAPESSARGG